MHQLVRGGELSAKAAWDLVDHHEGVVDGVVPEFTANLIFGNVSTVHLDDGAPRAFGKAIRRLAASRSRDDVALVGKDPF